MNWFVNQYNLPIQFLPTQIKGQESLKYKLLTFDISNLIFHKDKFNDHTMI